MGAWPRGEATTLLEDLPLHDPKDLEKETAIQHQVGRPPWDAQDWSHFPRDESRIVTCVDRHMYDQGLYLLAAIGVRSQIG